MSEANQKKADRRKHVLAKSGIEYTEYALNFQEGCFHGCTYPCYARVIKRVTSGDWMKPVDVPDAVEKLMADIGRLKGERPEVMMSTSHDPFQPQEVRTRLARKLILILIDEGFPIRILTKSHLIAEDPVLVNAMREYAPTGKIVVGFTIISTDEAVRKKWEPNTPPYHMRIESAKRLSAMGIPVWVSVEPILPYSDDWKNVVKVLGRHVDHFIFSKLNYNAISTKAIKDGWWARTRDEIAKVCKEFPVNNFIIKDDLLNVKSS